METKRFIPVAAPVIGEREIAYVTDAVRSGWVSSIGAYIERFEREFAAFVGVKHAIAVTNGTVALHLAFAALGIGPGDEVIVPDLTFVATVHGALTAGATPVLVDVEPDTWCLDPQAVARAIGPRTRAIVPVHLYGHPADMQALGRLAAAASPAIVLVEDAAEAHGARVGERVVGSLGRVGTFSFYGNKVMTTGEGGMLTTDDDALCDRLRFLKDHGMRPERRYYHTELAFNYRMTNLQAALGVAQLEQVADFIEKKRRIYGWYADELGARRDIALNVERPGAHNVYWMTSAVLAGASPRERDALCAELRAAGVDTRPFFVPMSELPHLAGLRRVGREGDDCPVARRLARRGFNLPSGCGLSEDDVRFAARTLARLLDG